MNEYFKILGHTVKDRVTGFSGTAASLCFDLYGCVQIVITPPVGEDGKIGDGHWFDAKRIEVLSDRPVMAVPNFEKTPAGLENGPGEKPAPRRHTGA